MLLWETSQAVISYRRSCCRSKQKQQSCSLQRVSPDFRVSVNFQSKELEFVWLFIFLLQDRESSRRTAEWESRFHWDTAPHSGSCLANSSSCGLELLTSKVVVCWPEASIFHQGCGCKQGLADWFHHALRTVLVKDR